MSAGGGVTEAAKTVESENKVKRYETVDEKVGLLIERCRDTWSLSEAK